MTPTEAAEIRLRAMRQLDWDRVSVHITARQVEDLACAYLNAMGDRARIAAMIPGALMAWACNDRDKTRDAFVEIEQLAKPNLKSP